MTGKTRNRFDLKGKLAMVTGASRGLGRAMAVALAEHGADLVLVARSEKGLDQTADAVNELGREAVVCPFNLANAESVPDLMDAIEREAGLPGILVNNAGTTRRAPATELELADWDAVMRVNVRGLFALSRELARRLMARERRGKIVNIASLMSRVARPGTTAYAASKGAVAMLTRSLAVEWAAHGINVNAIGPGYFKTELTRPVYEDEAFSRWVRQNTPMGRWGEPDDLAGAVVFLASPASDFVTGQILYVDGGWLSLV